MKKDLNHVDLVEHKWNAKDQEKNFKGQKDNETYCHSDQGAFRRKIGRSTLYWWNRGTDTPIEEVGS